MLRFLILLILLSACSNGRLIVSTPSRNELLTKAPPGPEGYQKGWRDGCDTGIGNSHNNFYKTFYTFKKDYNLGKVDPDYNFAWSQGYWYCSRYQERHNMNSSGAARYGGFM